MLSRRGLLLCATGALLSACGADPLEHDPGRNNGQKVTGSFQSTWRKATTGWTIAYPHGHGPGDSLPVVVSLHGRRGTHRTSFSSLRLDRYLDQVVRSGTPPFAIAAVDGGDHSYWHRRSDGTDASAMVREEFVPLLAEHGLDTSRLGLFGWSMGGYGALLMAGKQRLPVAAVAVSSPALFTSAGATAPGAFDDVADFAGNDVYDHPSWLRGVELRLDCGRQDPFYVASRDLAGRLERRPAGGFGNGDHDQNYWRSVAPAQLEFLGKLLTTTN